MYRIFLSLLSVMLILASCQNKNNPAITEVDVNGHSMKVIHFESIHDSLQISLTELAEDLRFVPLETRKECLVRYAEYDISDHFIVALSDNEKILQFDAHGHFIRQIARTGKGPREFGNDAIMRMDTERDILYVADGMKSYVMSWKLNTGEFAGNIPRVYTGRIKNLMVTEEGNLVFAPVIGYFESGAYYLWEQDTDGKLIRQISAPWKSGYHDSADKLLHCNGSGYNYVKINNDTVFQVQDTSLIPGWVIDLGKGNDKLIEQRGGRSFTYAFESKRFLSGRISTLQSIEKTPVDGGWVTRTQVKNQELIWDKNKNKIYLNEHMINDLTGQTLTSYQMNVLPSQTLVIPNQAIDLIEQYEAIQNDSNTDLKIQEKMAAVTKTLNPEDNPVLIIGRIR